MSSFENRTGCAIPTPSPTTPIDSPTPVRRCLLRDGSIAGLVRTWTGHKRPGSEQRGRSYRRRASARQQRNRHSLTALLMQKSCQVGYVLVLHSHDHNPVLHQRERQPSQPSDGDSRGLIRKRPHGTRLRRTISYQSWLPKNSP
jgi:hypothetical protein